MLAATKSGDCMPRLQYCSLLHRNSTISGALEINLQLNCTWPPPRSLAFGRLKTPPRLPKLMTRVDNFLCCIFEKSMQNEFRKTILTWQNSDLFGTVLYFMKYKIRNCQSQLQAWAGGKSPPLLQYQPALVGEKSSTVISPT